MAAEYQRWIKVANDLGLGGDELRTFVKDRQEEDKIERLPIEEADKKPENWMLNEKQRNWNRRKKFLAEQEARKLEAE